MTAAAVASSVSSSSVAVVIVPAPPYDRPVVVVVATIPFPDNAVEIYPRYDGMRPTRDYNWTKYVQEEPSSSLSSSSSTSIPVVRIDASKSELCNVCANKNWVSTISFVLENTRRFYTNDDSNYGHI